jgi:hypothetical protein
LWLLKTRHSSVAVSQFVVEFREPVTHHDAVGSGGSLNMMGQQCRSESLFYYFRNEEHEAENHLLRAIDRYVEHGKYTAGMVVDAELAGKGSYTWLL